MVYVQFTYRKSIYCSTGTYINGSCFNEQIIIRTHTKRIVVAIVDVSEGDDNAKGSSNLCTLLCIYSCGAEKEKVHAPNTKYISQST